MKSSKQMGRESLISHDEIPAATSVTLEFDTEISILDALLSVILVGTVIWFEHPCEATMVQESSAYEQVPEQSTFTSPMITKEKPADQYIEVAIQ